MRSVLDQVLRNLDDLKTFIDSIKPVREALAGLGDGHIRSYLRIRHRFDYSALIIALYSSFEQFVESLAAAYARIMSERMPYSTLPEKLRAYHLSQTGWLLRRRLGEGRYVSITALELVENLFHCLSDEPGYALNDVAITHHESNLRMRQVSELFGRLGLGNVAELMGKADRMVALYEDRAGTMPAPEQMPSSIERELEDLVERRNEIAHRGGQTDDLLSVDLMKEKVEFIEACAHALFAVVVTDHLTRHHVAGGLARSLGRPREGPYRGGRVVVVDNPAQRLCVDQAAFCLADGGVARWGRVRGLMVSDQPVECVEADSSADTIGIELDFKCTESRELYLLPHGQEDDTIWPAIESQAAR